MLFINAIKCRKLIEKEEEKWEIEKEEKWEGSCINAFCRKLFCEKISYFFKSLYQKKSNFVEQIFAI